MGGGVTYLPSHSQNPDKAKARDSIELESHIFSSVTEKVFMMLDPVSLRHIGTENLHLNI